VVLSGQRIRLADAPCPDAPHGLPRDGVLGAAAMGGLVIVVDYRRGWIGFRPRA